SWSPRGSRRAAGLGLGGHFRRQGRQGLGSGFLDWHGAQFAQYAEGYTDAVKGRTQQDAQVQPKAEFPDVIKVMCQLEADGRQARIRGESDLGQSANPGSNCQAFLVTGKGLVQVGKELGPFRTRADQAHVAAQDIDELGQFIQMTEAQEPAQPRDARVSGKGPARAGRYFAIMDHGANLQDGEKSALAAYPSLLVKGRPRRGQLDHNA